MSRFVLNILPEHNVGNGTEGMLPAVGAGTDDMAQPTNTTSLATYILDLENPLLAATRSLPTHISLVFVANLTRCRRQDLLHSKSWCLDSRKFDSSVR